MPAGVAPRGGYYVLDAGRNLFTANQQPLLVGFPVPPGADTAHLALGTLTTLYEEGANGEPYWDFLDGLYDAEQNLFLTTLPYLSAAGQTFALAEHPDFDSPPNGALAQAAGKRVGVFTVDCKLFLNPADCTPATEELVAGYLNDIYTRLTSDSMGFTEFPYLRSPLGHIILEHTTSLESVQGFAARIQPAGLSLTECKNSAGSYNHELARLTICLDPAKGITTNLVHTMIHEYFHATQYGYAIFQQDVEAGNEQDWIIEGMATAAKESYFVDNEMLRTQLGGWERPQKVDDALDVGISTDNSLNEYFAQDFWVYVGQRFGLGLGYLAPILQTGGATTAGVIAALENELGVPFHELYWGWVKNQVFEKELDLGGGLGARCTLTNDALTPSVSPVVWNYDPEENIEFPPDAPIASIDPLHAMVIEVKFPEDMVGAIVEVGLDGCQGLLGDAEIACRLEKQKLLHAKIYVQGEANCETDLAEILPLEGWRDLDNLSPANRYFVVLANADRSAQQHFWIGIEPQ
jgi:hypothetical protein